MKRIKQAFPFSLTIIAIVCSLQANPRRSLLDNDPTVIYLDKYLDQPIYLTTKSSTPVFSTKTGHNKLGTFPANTKVKLLAISKKNTYRVKGKAKHDFVSGWVSPQKLNSTDKNFIANLKQFYNRQRLVNDLIKKKEVAIGMTLKEVRMSLGEPTETEIKQTKEGLSGTWSYVVTFEKKYYNTFVDPRSGQTYRQVSRIVTEEKERTTVEFKKGIVISVTRKTNKGRPKTQIIPVPIPFCW